MSNPENNSGSGGLPAAVVTGVLGLALGVGGTILGMTNMGYTKSENAKAKPDAATAPGNGPAGGMTGGGMMGGGMMGGGGMPGGGMMGGGGGGGWGGGGGGGGKRTLTTLVGKLELLSRKDLKLRVELTPEQVGKVTEVLAKLQSAEKMTADESTAFQKSLEELMTKEQTEVLNQIGLPMGGGGGRGAGGGGGGGMMGGGGGGGGMMGGGGGAANQDENPFTQETNQKRLKDLLDRLKPAA